MRRGKGQWGGRRGANGVCCRAYSQYSHRRYSAGAPPRRARLSAARAAATPRRVAPAAPCSRPASGALVARHQPSESAAAPPARSRLREGSRGTGDFRPGLTTAPQPPIEGATKRSQEPGEQARAAGELRHCQGRAFGKRPHAHARSSTRLARPGLTLPACVPRPTVSEAPRSALEPPGPVLRSPSISFWPHAAG